MIFHDAKSSLGYVHTFGHGPEAVQQGISENGNDPRELNPINRHEPGGNRYTIGQASLGRTLHIG